MQRLRYLGHLSANGGKFPGGHRTSSAGWLSVLECVKWDYVAEVFQLTDGETGEFVIEVNDHWKKRFREITSSKDFSGMDMVSLLHEVRLFNERAVDSNMRRAVEDLSSNTTVEGLEYLEELKSQFDKSLTTVSDSRLITGVSEVELSKVDSRLWPAIQFVCSWNETVTDCRNSLIDAEVIDAVRDSMLGAGGHPTSNQLWRSIGRTGLFALPEVLRRLELKELRTQYFSASEEATTGSSADVEDSAATTDVEERKSEDSQSCCFSEMWHNLRDGFLTRLDLDSLENANMSGFYSEVIDAFQNEELPYRFLSSEAVFDYMRDRTRAAVRTAIGPYIDDQTSETTSDFESLLLRLLRSQESFLLVPIIEVLMEEKKKKTLDEYLKDHIIRDSKVRSIITSISEDIVGCKEGTSDKDVMVSARHLQAKLLYPNIVFESLHPL